jgi:uncharacterized protein YqeY
MTGLESKIKEEITTAIKEGFQIKRNLLRTVVGETQRLPGIPRDQIDSDNRYVKVMKKIVETNTETLSLLQEGDLKVPVLASEIEILNNLLPAEITSDDVLSFIQGNASCLDQVVHAKSNGQAVGIVIKAMKSSGKTVSGETVSKIIQRLRQ